MERYVLALEPPSSLESTKQYRYRDEPEHRFPWIRELGFSGGSKHFSSKIVF